MTVNDNTVVITGVSGRYSEADSIQEFWEKLINGVPLYSSDSRRWPNEAFDFPKYSGRIKDISRMDSDFFGFTKEEVDLLDPALRLLLEVIYECILDAGLDPKELRGTKTGFFLGNCFYDFEFALAQRDYEGQKYFQHTTTRIPYMMDWRGLASQFDTACASSFSAFEAAFEAMKYGYCDQAVVAGIEVNMKPSIVLGFQNLGMIAKDGRSKCLDAKADGYCRSEGVIAILLQKKSDSKRIYAHVLNTESNCDGYKEEGITFPRLHTQSKLIRETVKNAQVDPLDIEYVEAHLTGTQAGDPIESNAILEALRPESTKPLLFGALKSNIGHSEAASALCAISKVIKIFQKREIPANINYETPNPAIKGLKEGRIIPVLERTPFNKDFISINSFGFGGVNVHAILSPTNKIVSKESYLIADTYPRLIQVCNRSEQGIQCMFEWFEKTRTSLTRDYLGLLNDISKMDPEQGFDHRGCLLLDQEKILTSSWNRVLHKKLLSMVMTPLDKDLIYLCKPLFKFKVFEETIKNLAQHLEPMGYNLVKEMQNGHHKRLENVHFNAVISTVAIQMGLINLLRHLDVEIENFFSYSYGEVAAAYANQAIDEKQAILTAYWLGLFQEKKLADQSSLAEKLKTIVTNGKVNSFDLNNFVNRITSSVDSQETLNLPDDGLIIMIGNVPPFLNASLLKSFVHMVSDNQPQENMVQNILTSIGELYCNGHNPSIEKLYPKVEYPVERETETISHLIKWQHPNSFFIPRFPKYFSHVLSSRQTYTIDINNPEGRFLRGHCIDGRILFPATGYIVVLSQVIASSLGYLDFTKIPIDFYDFKLRKPLLLTPGIPIKAVVQIWKEAQKFQISSNNEVCAEGYYTFDYSITDYKSLMVENSAPDAMKLKKKDFYKLLRIRGYDYKDVFQGVEEAMSDGSWSQVKFSKNWIAFADACLQVAILDKKTGLYVPTGIEYMRCDYPVLRKTLEEANIATEGSESKLKVYFNKLANVGVTNGMIIKGLKAAAIPRRTNTQYATLETFEFQTYDQNIALTQKSKDNLEKYLAVCRQCFEVFKGDETKEVDKSAIKKYCDIKNCRYSLLSTMNEVLSKQKDENGNIVKNKDELLQDLIENLKKNITDLSKDYTFERPLAASAQLVAQIIIDNVYSKMLNIMEVNLTKDPINDFLQEYLEYSGIRSNVTLMVPEAEIGAYAEANTNEKIVGFSTEKKPNTQLECSDFIVFKDPRSSFYTNLEAINGFKLEHILQTCFDNLKQTGFVLLFIRLQLSEIEKEFNELINVEPYQFYDLTSMKTTIEKLGFEMVSQKETEDQSWMTVVLKKSSDVESLKNSMKVIQVETEKFEWVEELRKSLPDDNVKRIWLTTTGSPVNGMLGMVQCLKKEPKGNKLRCLFNMAKEDGPKNRVTLTDELIKKDLMMNVFDDKQQYGCILSECLSNMDEVKTTSKNIYLDIVTKGDLTSLRWFKAQYDSTKTTDLFIEKDVELSVVNIYYSALNFKDIMLASGRISIDGYSPLCQGLPTCLGIEYSGIHENGERIMGIVQGQAIANTLVIDKRCLKWKVPDTMSLEEAATIPVCYYTVYYSLIIRGKLKNGEKVLIHAGSGGVGQAAIAVCLKRKCEVFTTVSTQEKRDFLKEKFPQLTDDHISNSRSTEFEEQVLKMTNGVGVDLVLNSLADDKLQASIRCLTDYGRFLEIGKYDIMMDSKLDGTTLDHNKTIEVICLSHLEAQIIMDEAFAHKDIKNKLNDLMNEGLQNGEVVPLNRTIFEMDQAEEAFRHMAGGKHIGKVLIKIRDEVEEPTPIEKYHPCLAQTHFNPYKCYIIIGGLGGFGLEVAKWMVERGATKLVLTSRTGPKDAYQRLIIHNLQNHPIFKTRVEVSTQDCLTKESVNTLLDDAEKLGEIGGIFLVAMILKDGLFENQTKSKFEQVYGSKGRAASFLDEASRERGLKLDYFVCFSSLVTSKGNIGQSNYGFANSALERICELRKKDGLPGLAIQWGALGDVGFVHEVSGGRDIEILSTVPQRLPSFFQTFDKFLTSSHTVVSSLIIANHHRRGDDKHESLLAQVYNILGIKDPSTIDPNSTLADLGIDSLMVVEIKQGLEREYDVVMTTQEIRSMKVSEIAKIDEERKNNSKLSILRNKQKESINKLDLLKPPTTVFLRLTTMTGRPVFFLPGMDNDFRAFSRLGELLSRPVIGLNWVEDIDNFDTVQEVGRFYARKLYDKYPDNNEFEFIGYSYGGTVGLELCIAIQELYGSNYVRNLFMLDSSPEITREIAKKIVLQNDEYDAKHAFVETMIKIVNNITPVEISDEFRSDLLSIEDTRKRCTKLTDYVQSKFNTTIDPEKLNHACDRYLTKLNMMYNFSSTKQFLGDVTMIRSSEEFGQGDDSEDYGLSKHITGTVSLSKMTGNHETFLTSNTDEIAAIIEAKIFYYQCA